MNAPCAKSYARNVLFAPMMTNTYKLVICTCTQ